MEKQIMDCACVIHGDAYEWRYVDRLYDMLRANSNREIRLHVFTEPTRPVPTHMVRHDLVDWPGVGGPKKAWWYKIQMFDPRHFSGRLLYMDLDVVIVRNIDWIWNLNPRYFWAVHDFRRLWRPTWQGINSSIMLWDTQRWQHVWQEFQDRNIAATIKQFHGDQDFLNSVIDPAELRFIDPEQIHSWRWEIKDGGMDIKSRTYKRPDAGSVLTPKTSVIIFHGEPKPHQVLDTIIQKHWNITVDQ